MMGTEDIHSKQLPFHGGASSAKYDLDGDMRVGVDTELVQAPDEYV
jgi:hypothetical protein